MSDPHPLHGNGGPSPCDGDAARPRRVVLVAVGQLDLRARVAARYASLVPAGERRAVHVDVDQRSSHGLGLAWLESQPGLPLEVLDDEGGVATTIAAAVERSLASGADEAVVIVGSLAVRGLGRGSLHDATADEITRAVSRVPGALGLQVPIAGVAS